jgi:hypothetical protein
LAPPLEKALITASTKRKTNAITMSILVTVEVSFCKGVLFLLYIFAVASIFDAKVSSPRAVTL